MWRNGSQQQRDLSEENLLSLISSFPIGSDTPGVLNSSNHHNDVMSDDYGDSDEDEGVANNSNSFRMSARSRNSSRSGIDSIHSSTTSSSTLRMSEENIHYFKDDNDETDSNQNKPGNGKKKFDSVKKVKDVIFDEEVPISSSSSCASSDSSNSNNSGIEHINAFVKTMEEHNKSGSYLTKASDGSTASGMSHLSGAKNPSIAVGADGDGNRKHPNENGNNHSNTFPSARAMTSASYAGATTSPTKHSLSVKASTTSTSSKKESPGLDDTIYIEKERLKRFSLDNEKMSNFAELKTSLEIEYDDGTGIDNRDGFGHDKIDTNTSQVSTFRKYEGKIAVAKHNNSGDENDTDDESVDYNTALSAKFNIGAKATSELDNIDEDEAGTFSAMDILAKFSIILHDGNSYDRPNRNEEEGSRTSSASTNIRESMKFQQTMQLLDQYDELDNMTWNESSDAIKYASSQRQHKPSEIHPLHHQGRRNQKLPDVSAVAKESREEKEAKRQRNEAIFLLHALFANFCSPPPSLESIRNILLMETKRVLFVTGNNKFSLNVESNDSDDFNGNFPLPSLLPLPSSKEILKQPHHQQYLPKDAVINTHFEAAQSVISLLQSSPSQCFLELPLEFQLSFIRILMRLLSKESDEEYDEECMFRCKEDIERLLYNGDNTDESSEQEGDTETTIEQNDGNDSNGRQRCNSIDTSFSDRTPGNQDLNRRRCNSANASQIIAPSYQQSTSNSNGRQSSHRDHLHATKKALSFSRRKSKKSSPLYSIVRFRSHPKWNMPLASKSDQNVKRSIRHQRWSFVASRALLDLDKEDFLRGNEGFDERQLGDYNQEVPISSDAVETLIRLFQATLIKCLKRKEKSSLDCQFLVLGPVARLLGLVCATGASVKELRSLLVLLEGSPYTNPIAPLERESKNTDDIKGCNSTLLHLARLHAIRALRYAAESSAHSSSILDKAGPPTFFSFGCSAVGLSSVCTHQTWPFKNDFGMACWFRAETFGVNSGSSRNGENAVLFRARTDDGAWIEAAFDPCSSDPESTAAMLVITAGDVHDPRVYRPPREIRLSGCVLAPQVWYHVAIRLTRPRANRFSLSSFTIKDEITIFLNGKVMLKDNMRMPNLTEPNQGGAGKLLRSSMGTGGLLRSSVGPGGLGRGLGKTLSSRGTFFSKSTSSEVTEYPLQVSYLFNFDGQAGTLYVFNDTVSDEAFQVLHRETAGPFEKSNNASFSTTWDGTKGKLTQLAKVVNSASMHTELEDVVLPNYPVLIGTHSRRMKVLFDLIEEDDVMASRIPAELSKSSFGSKLFMVWDPCRVSDGVVIDAHSGLNAELGERVSRWTFESIKDTIGSLGGMQRLLPLFSALSSLPVDPASTFNAYSVAGKHRPLSNNSLISSISRGIKGDYINMVLPSLFSLFSSFIREHEVNARELYRCGGINVIEKFIHDHKKRIFEISKGDYYGLGSSPMIAYSNVCALLDLWQSSRHNFGLETTIFSRLLFNIQLLLGGLADCPCVALHTALLPVLSELAKLNPEKVRDCVETRDLFEFVHEYSGNSSTDTAATNDESSNYPSPTERNNLHLDSRLTPTERGLVIDLAFGIITISLSQRCYTNNLYPLITFISYNINLEWEELPDRTEGNGETKRDNRYKTTLKAVSVLLFLLQKNPPVPHLIESLHEIFENGNGVASWVLCCIVNSNDDSIRALGIKCLTAYLHAVMSSNQSSTLDPSNHLSNIQGTQKEGATAKLTMTMKYVGTGLGVISQSANALSNLISGRFNVKVIYKLLWHLLKCHREELGDASTAALMYLLVDDGSSASGSVKLSDVLVQKNTFLGGFSLSTECLTSQYSNGSPTLARQNIRNTHGVGTVLRLLRFLSPDQKERWLFDFLALILASPNGVNMILACDDWQPCLFQLVAEVIEEINGDSNVSGNDYNATQEKQSTVDALNILSSTAVDTEPLSRPSVRTRYDLSLKLYSTLLGHCVRQGDEKAFDAVEMAASLQRVDANGSEVFSIILSHLFADLIEKGTVAHVEDTYDDNESVNVRNRALKQSARLVTQSILSNGTEGLDMTSAVRQWRCLRHLTAVGVAVVASNGFGVAELFDYRNQDAAAVDGITGGMYGIRLDNMVSGINAFEALAGAKLHSNTIGRKQRERYRYVCVVLASQILTLLDAFIFPDNLDSSKAASQLHGLALVRSTEPRLGKSQGPLLASLVRLSLILLAYLEPSSVRFLQACSRLRCFLHWTLEIIRESVALGGYSVAFHELNAPLDRLVLAIVLQCHRALSRCSVVLVEMESSPWDKYFSDSESRQKSHRRLFRAILELREIVFAAYRGRNEVLRAALSLQAHEALARGLEEMSSPKFLLKSSKESSLRTFLKNDWMTGFHDVEAIGDMMISEQVANGQVYKNRTATTIGRQAITELISENAAIVKEYSDLLGIPFNLYCENQRRWAETEAVRERESEGNEIVKKYAIKYRSDSVESNKILMAKFSLAMKRMLWIVRSSHDPWNPFKRWIFPSITDTLYRRILFAPNYYFNDHADACYDSTLGKERDKITLEETRRKEKEREMTEALLRVGDAIVPYDESALEDADDDEPEKADDEILIGWKSENDENSESDNDNIVEQNSISKDAESVTLESKSICSEWDQFDEADFGESDDSDPYAWAKKFMWSEGEHFVQSFETVVIVSLQNTMEGKLLLTTQNIYFRQTEDALDVFTKQPIRRDDESPRQDLKWKLSRLTDIHGRRYMLKAQGVELFFADMKGLFLKFGGMKERDVFFSKLTSNCKAPLLRPMKSLNPRTVFKKAKLTDLWRKRKISNFQYLMMLNLMAGRTFNDVTQYPVFPWVLCDYTSETLDLSDHRIYRDLSKPVGALNPDRLAQLIERYNDLDGFVSEEEKFLYGSHYSSPGVVLHYLVRQEPYTSMHIALQSGRFDCADRMFHDVAGCWNSCMTSTSDVKELTPEFFTCPEIFVNTNNFPLGQTQSKKPISSVKLPPWAKGSPHEFIRIHRLALESEYVSNNLHHWIDLIFGYKQRGPAAAANHNVFHYLSYEGSVDLDKITDDVTRQATESHIQNFGQTPSQLIVKDPHPPRSRLEDDGPLLEKNLQALRCHTPAKQFGGPRNSEANGPVISLHALGEYIFAVYSDLSLCSYKIHPIRGVVPFTFKAEKTRRILSRKGSRSLFAVWHALNVDDDLPFEAESKSKKNLCLGLGNSSFAITLGGSAKLSSSAVNATDSSYLLMSCGYFDNCLKVQTLDSTNLRCNQNGGHRGQINCLQVGEDGTVMVTGGQDSTCRVWVIDHDSFASSLTDGYVYSTLGAESSLVRCCHVLIGHVSPITCIAISTKLDVVISGSEDGSICIHNIRSGKFVRSLHVDASTKEVKHSCAINGLCVRNLAIHVNGTFVANLSDEKLYLFTVNGEKLADINLEEELHSMIICQQSERLITGGERGLAKIWTLHDLSLDCTVDVSTYGAITSLVLTPMDLSQTAQYLCVGSSNGSLSIVYKSLESSSFK